MLKNFHKSIFSVRYISVIYLIIIEHIFYAIKYFFPHDNVLFDLIKLCFPLFYEAETVFYYSRGKQFECSIVPSTSHPRLLHIIKPPSELDEKRIERRKPFTDVQDLRIWNIIRVLLVRQGCYKKIYCAIPHL